MSLSTALHTSFAVRTILATDSRLLFACQP
jgi:hypothetical protein